MIGSPAAEPAATSQTLVTSVTQRIRADIIDGSFAPGHKLKVRQLAERYSIGIGPVREALSRLVASNLVTVEDHKGFRVSALSLPQLERLTWTRINVECLALRESIRQGDLAWQAGLVAALHELQHTGRNPYSAWEEKHFALHRALLCACASPWLLHFVDTLFEQSSIYRRLQASTEPRMPPQRDHFHEHESLVQAAIQRDAELACTLLTAHYESTFDHVRQAYAERKDLSELKQ